MQNDPELNGKYLGTITADFAAVADTLKEASYQLRVRGISAHPIFPICKEAQPIGQLLIGKAELALQWNYYFSFLDEFLQRGLIDGDRREAFLEAYRDPDEWCCLFVIDGDFVNFVYIPYPEDL
jgi:hypothetical protein